MRKLLSFTLPLFFCLLSYSCADTGDGSKSSNTDTATHQQQTTANEEDTIIFATANTAVITFVVDTNILLSDWQNYLSSIPEIGACALNQVQIVTNAENKFFMVASGTLGAETLKSTIQLEKNAANDLFVTGMTISCTTTKCSHESFGCVPNYTSCTACANKGECTKNITSTPKVIFPDL